jgi:predicted nucleic acid-binding Zn ribbon protein
VSRDEPVPLRDALRALGDELGLPTANAFETVIAVWQDLVGPDGARHTRVRAVRNGECTIEVDGPAWATRVRYLTDDLVRRANELRGEPFLTSAKVVVAGSRSAG